jgi:hypothetical protein
MKVKTTKTPPIEVSYDLHLTMTTREAKALLTILDHVGGLTSGPRGATDTLYVALYNITRPGKLKSGTAGSLTLPNTWEELDK